MKKVLVYIYYKFLEFYKLLFFLYLPNFLFIFKKTTIVNFKNIKNPAQKIFFTGQGSIIFKGKCHFGYKAGGFNYGGSIEIQPRFKSSKILFGNNIHTNNNIFICAANSIDIGDDVMIGQNVTIMDFEAHGIQPDKRKEIGSIGTIKIKQNVWIGNNVMILKNSVIGENTIIAAGAIVSGTFRKNVIIGGVPAKVIKNL